MRLGLAVIAVAAGCACLESSPLQGVFQVNETTGESFVPVLLAGLSTGAVARAPTSYGVGCAAHDATVHPVCMGAAPPSWCSAPWCFVDGPECVGAIGAADFPESNAWMSYEPCGPPAASVDAVRDLEAARSVVEAAWADIKAGEVGDDDCGPALPVNCALFTLGDATADGVLVRWDVTGTSAGPESSLGKGRANCLARVASSLMAKMLGPHRGASASANATARALELSTFTTAGGDVVQYPLTNHCVGDADVRGEAWYSFAQTGPRDIVIVVDMSTSMNEKNRKQVAQAAVAQVLGTLTALDHAAVVVYSSDAVISSPKLVPVTAENRARMVQFINSVVASGR